MARRDILAELGINKDQIEAELQAALAGISYETLEEQLDDSVKDFNANTILEGRVVGIHDGQVMIDIGYKSEGVVRLWEWPELDPPKPGDVVEVLLESIEGGGGLVQISKRKADRIRNWERVVTRYDEGDIITGYVIRKIKGGLLVDIGVPVFLPASQVDIRRPADIGEFIGRQLTCRVLKIDQERRNIVVSRRMLIENQRRYMKDLMLANMEKSQIRPGKVKNIVDFGAFVDLGGIDGLLHITDMSWGRVSHPSEMVAIDDLIDVVILNVDINKEKVALGLKQKTASPWQSIEEKYPVGSSVTGEVVNLMSYGAFVKLEEGVEGLVHISEMSWTRRINHPSELVAIGDMVEVAVLAINRDKEEISLGMKQTEQNPWELVQENYPVGTEVVGRVRNLTSYGAFIEIEEGIDGLLHVSDMSWTRKISHPSEVVQKGQTVKTTVIEVDPEKRRVALGLKQLGDDPWQTTIPARYHADDLVRGTVAKLTSFGAFVELQDGLEGLLHISELSEKKIPSPEEIVEVGDIVDVRVIRVDTESRKIGLSLRTNDMLPDDEQPRIVLRSDQIADADDGAALAAETLAAGKHISHKPTAAVEAATSGATPHSSLNIPTSVATDAPEETEEVEETEVVEEVEEVEETEPAEEPVVEEPAVDEPADEEPVVEEPVVEEPVVEDLIVEELLSEVLTVDEEPVVEELIVEDIIADVTTEEDLIVDEPADEEPVVEELPVEEPAAEEPVEETDTGDDTL